MRSTSWNWRPAVCFFVASTAFAGEAFGDTLASGRETQFEIDDEFIVGVSQPTALAFLPDGRALVTQRTGELILRQTDGSLTSAGSFVVNAAHGEQGLLNVVPHPNFEENHELFFFYSAEGAIGGTASDRHRVVSVVLGEDGTLDMASERILLRGLQGPANHNGGGLAIVGDYLFVGTGDTGNNSGAPPGQSISNYYGTCLTNAQGKVLRIHLDGSIPVDNPLVARQVTACGSGPAEAPTTTTGEPRSEIFAWGFRNAFRLWGDERTGRVWVGDVGEVTFEMIHVLPAEGARHFGWPYREGNQGQPVSACQAIEPNVGDCTDATYVCPHTAEGCSSISGGRILDDCVWPAELAGHYVFGDYASQRVWTLPVDAERTMVVGEREPLLSTAGAGPVAFAEFDGALYVVSYSGSGHVTRLAPLVANPACMTDEPVRQDAGAQSAPSDAGLDGAPTDASFVEDAGPRNRSPMDASVTDAQSPRDGSGAQPEVDAGDGGGVAGEPPSEFDASLAQDASAAESEPDPPLQRASSDAAPSQANRDSGASSTNSEDSGCACRVQSQRSTGVWFAFAALSLLGVRRRRSG